ncbi:MAG: cytochrome c3 family protein [Myxococcota bacterium]
MRLAALLLLLAPLAALAGDEAAAIFERFDHREHEPALRKAQVGCSDCHGLGVVYPAGEAVKAGDRPLTPPEASCHACHAPGEGDLGRGGGMAPATRWCQTCHAEVEQPETHAPGWSAQHGRDALVSAASCRDCHARAECADCHDRRENARARVHEPAWLTLHGIATRAGPAGCDSCHAEAECTTCHASAAGFGRGR